MQEAELGQVTVEENRAVDDRAAAMVGDNKDRRIGREAVDDLAGRSVESLIHLADCIPKLRRQLSDRG